MLEKLRRACPALVERAPLYVNLLSRAFACKFEYSIAELKVLAVYIDAESRYPLNAKPISGKER